VFITPEVRDLYFGAREKNRRYSVVFLPQVITNLINFVINIREKYSIVRNFQTDLIKACTV
jgi:hypothetical protein